MKGTAIGFYFRLPKAAANQIRANLASLAKKHGYTATAGPTAGEGNPSELLINIATGEVALVLLPDQHRPITAAWLRAQAQALRAANADFTTLGLAEDLEVIAKAID